MMFSELESVVLDVAHEAGDERLVNRCTIPRKWIEEAVYPLGYNKFVIFHYHPTGKGLYSCELRRRR